MDRGHLIRLSIYIGVMAVVAGAVVAHRLLIRQQQRIIDCQRGDICALQKQVRSLQRQCRVLMHDDEMLPIAPVVPLAAYANRHREKGVTAPEAVPLPRE